VTFRILNLRHVANADALEIQQELLLAAKKFASRVLAGLSGGRGRPRSGRCSASDALGAELLSFAIPTLHLSFTSQRVPYGTTSARPETNN
jgi:hypothetical protein